jgi:hypothetical protein
MARARSTIERTTGAHLPSIRTVRDRTRPLKAVTTLVTARGDPQTRRTHSAMSWPSLTVRMVSTLSTTARSTIRIRNASGLRDRLSSYVALRHPGPQKTRGRPVPAAGGRVAPHRMHRVGVTRLTVVFRTSPIVGRCAKLPRFVTDETGGFSICKRRGSPVKGQQMFMTAPRISACCVRVPLPLLLLLLAAGCAQSVARGRV